MEMSEDAPGQNMKKHAQMDQSAGAMATNDVNMQQSAVTESYEDRKASLAERGQLIPAYKHSSLKAPITRLDRRGNVIGQDKKKFHLTYCDYVVKEPLVRVHCVESYKKYNAEDPIQGDTPCCTIF